ncbi:hypothetical protein TSAR_002983 [Trichomalopsis sarcophagae]|uniref:Uncharacterized protein n=1 Tax=Trichomalopsis sarcophagae TaxID=543379 RepID=A0A232FC00_9HYME|nr:hypothetical protein TSAR_002983 [Trichomalopsis sarcophagae]
MKIKYRKNIRSQGSHAKQNSNGNSVVTVDEKGFREQDIPGMVKDAQAQRGGTATLPCKLIDNGAGIVSIEHDWTFIAVT